MKVFTIGEVAKKLNINVETLYYYDRKGLLPFVHRDEKGNRCFTVDDIEMVLTILHLKNAGVTLKEIKQFILWRLEGDQTLEERWQFIQKQEKILEEKIQQLIHAREILRYKDWYYQTAVEAGTEQIHLLPNTYQYNQDAQDKFLEMIDQMSEEEKFLFEIEKQEK